MLFIAGLGNPGTLYQDNRHNIGFMAVDAIHQSFSFAPWTKNFQSEISKGLVHGEKVFLIKPQTFMNLSGQAVNDVLRFYKSNPSHLIVIHDELDLEPGTIRIKKGGGSNGHNGLKSIDAHCGNNYHRIRLGIGHPGSKELVHRYVLDNFTQSDQKWLPYLLRAIANNIPALIKGDGHRFTNTISSEMQIRDP